MAKRKYKKNRASRKGSRLRIAYEAYSDYYDKVSKGGAFNDKYSFLEFAEEYYDAKDAGIKNPAIAIARSQRQWSYNFERKYRKATGESIKKDLSNEEREQIFIDFVENQYDGDYEAGRAAFEALY